MSCTHGSILGLPKTTQGSRAATQAAHGQDEAPPFPLQRTGCIQKYLPLTPSLWNAGCKPIFAAVEHISARRQPILNLHSGRDSPGPLTTAERRRAVKVQDNGPHWVGYFGKAPELLTSKKEDCCLASLSMNGALETELKEAVELQLEVCVQVPKGSVPRRPRP